MLINCLLIDAGVYPENLVMFMLYVALLKSVFFLTLICFDLKNKQKTTKNKTKQKQQQKQQHNTHTHGHAHARSHTHNNNNNNKQTNNKNNNKKQQQQQQRKKKKKTQKTRVVGESPDNDTHEKLNYLSVFASKLCYIKSVINNMDTSGRGGARRKKQSRWRLEKKKRRKTTTTTTTKKPLPHVHHVSEGINSVTALTMHAITLNEGWT